MQSQIQQHIEQFFAGHTIDYLIWECGPAREAMPELRIARIAPGPRTGLWCYVSVGASTTPNEGARLEFFLLSPHESPRCVELVTMAAHRHTVDSLGKWHLLPIGEPWLEGATCDVFFISPPYPFGPELEVCNFMPPISTSCGCCR